METAIEFFVEHVLFLIFLLLISLLLYLPILIPNYFYKKYSCHSKGQEMGIDTNYSFFNGCMLHTKDGNVIPLENYRVTIVK